jgi:hypothetical protein
MEKFYTITIYNYSKILSYSIKTKFANIYSERLYISILEVEQTRNFILIELLYFKFYLI